MKIISPQSKFTRSYYDVRPIIETDLESLASVYVDVYTTFDVGEIWDKMSAHKMLKFWFEHFPGLAFVATNEEKIIGGFLAGIKPWCDGNHLIDGEIFVHPDHQQNGVDGKLMKVMLEAARDKYQAVVWDTYTFRNFEHPMSWYKQMGFEEIRDWVMISCDIGKTLQRLG
jgi:GNAT superfamily N-acetyltransferase